MPSDREASPRDRTVADSHRFRWRGAVGVAILVPAFLVTAFSAPRLALGSPVDFALNGLGWMAFVAGAGVRFWATLFIGGYKDRVLVTDGPYSLCRNPLYLGSFLLNLSAALFLKSVVFLGALGAVTAIYLITTIPAEEEFLRARHGADFDRYCREVPRLWPAFRRYRTADRIEVNVHTLWLECARASRWVWMPFLALAVWYLRSQPWWPHFIASLIPKGSRLAV